MAAKRRALRRKILTVRVTPQEYKRVTRQAKKDGMERADWIRRLWEAQFAADAGVKAAA